MVDKQQSPETKARLASALRANLRKRKAAARKAPAKSTPKPDK